MTSLLLMLALQAAPEPAPAALPNGSCTLECGMTASACIVDCAGDLDPEKPENRSKVEACTKTCSAAAQPCLQKCKRAQGRKR